MVAQAKSATAVNGQLKSPFRFVYWHQVRNLCTHIHAAQTDDVHPLRRIRAQRPPHTQTDMHVIKHFVLLQARQSWYAQTRRQFFGRFSSENEAAQAAILGGAAGSIEELLRKPAGPTRQPACKSMYKFVYWHRVKSKWFVSHGGRHYGCFDTQAKAAAGAVHVKLAASVKQLKKKRLPSVLNHGHPCNST